MDSRAGGQLGDARAPVTRHGQGHGVVEHGLPAALVVAGQANVADAIKRLVAAVELVVEVMAQRPGGGATGEARADVALAPAAVAIAADCAGVAGIELGWHRWPLDHAVAGEAEVAPPAAAQIELPQGCGVVAVGARNRHHHHIGQRGCRPAEDGQHQGERCERAFTGRVH